MRWEVAVVVLLVLTLAVEAILTLRPIPQAVVLQPDQDDPAKKLHGRVSSKA